MHDTGILGNNHRIPEVGNVFLNVLEKKRRRAEIIHRNGEEALQQRIYIK